MMRVCDEGRRSGGSHLSPRGVAQARTHTVAQLFFFLKYTHFVFDPRMTSGVQADILRDGRAIWSGGESGENKIK